MKRIATFTFETLDRIVDHLIVSSKCGRFFSQFGTLEITGYSFASLRSTMIRIETSTLDVDIPFDERLKTFGFRTRNLFKCIDKLSRHSDHVSLYVTDANEIVWLENDGTSVHSVFMPTFDMVESMTLEPQLLERMTSARIYQNELVSILRILRKKHVCLVSLKRNRIRLGFSHRNTLKTKTIGATVVKRNAMRPFLLRERDLIGSLVLQPLVSHVDIFTNMHETFLVWNDDTIQWFTILTGPHGIYQDFE